MTDRMAFFRRSRGVIGGFVTLLEVLGSSVLGCVEPSVLKHDCESIDCRTGDNGERGSDNRLKVRMDSPVVRSSPCSTEVAKTVPIDETRLKFCPAASKPFCTYREPQPKPLLTIEIRRSAIKFRKASFRTSESHFCPRWCTNVHLSDANQAETAARPNEVNAVKTVVIVDVTLPCGE